MSSATSPYNEVVIDDIWGLSQISLPRRSQRSQERLEVEILTEESSSLSTTSAPMFLGLDLDVSSTSATFATLPGKEQNLFTVILGAEVPTRANAFIAERINSSKALVEGSLNKLLRSKGAERLIEFDSLVKLSEPELLISVGLDLFAQGKGERVLSLASSVADYAGGARAAMAYVEPFKSQRHGVALLISPFLNLSISGDQKVETLLPLTSTQNITLAKTLVEELQGTPSTVSKPLLEHLTRSPITDVSALAKEALQEVA